MMNFLVNILGGRRTVAWKSLGQRELGVASTPGMPRILNGVVRDGMIAERILARVSRVRIGSEESPDSAGYGGG
jgi:hypothetical protein